MSKFKAGDKVVCIDAEESDDYLVYGNNYEITDYYDGSDKIVPEVYIVENGHCWMESRFELAEEDVTASRNKHKLDTYSIHELLDRLHIVQDIIASNLESHPASHLVEKELMLAQGWLSKAYQIVGEARFKEE